MTSNYKKLGRYIRQVSGRNNDLSVTNLQGVSITKKFIPSIANTIGTNMSTYKIVRRNQFAYGPVTSRNGDKISVALLDQDEAIISQAYTVFEVINHDELDPEYLMMWFRRPEFDRYARFKSHGSVREIFGWDEMCDVDLPVPDIIEQRRIVSEYKAVTNRIKLNKRLIKKLEDTAQAIYKQWFIDFEFPVSQQYAESIGKPELAGHPYKTSGGEMRHDSILKKDVPSFWKTTPLHDLVDNTLGGDWGKAEPAGNYNDAAYCIRGTDINNVSRGIITGAPIRYLLPKNFQSRSLNPGQIVFEISGGSPIQSTGRACLISDDLVKSLDKGVICSNFCRAISLKSNKFINIFFSHIQYLYSCGVMFRYENSTTGVKNFSLESFLDQETMVVPDDHTLNDFNGYFEKINTSLYNSARQLEVISNHKGMILSELMLGEN